MALYSNTSKYIYVVKYNKVFLNNHYIMSEFHNLDIHMYSLNEILDLFGLTYDISIEDLKRAKKGINVTS